ncbi:tRNA (guanosine(46)-N7)-methyltransferase TrmB [Staphylococcus gallinarum]|jgi:tRNA (guanine-N7-)-methyltransferase|uniref:tRNA (guanosine(46)-N7)-methyltransferase TrmB n=1 Tax=Staphylococcus gallinarum TaxID=1293 RepID=UPI001E357E02|nr:tRNA (guanosine(46)-N7)-methyltransferase TrmB [Staphylococcus gallinarum]MCD8899257.1 tRNA (guanosine(46)-N7)-methyltransferase TrmB [Staphylococcus gallinarum]MCD8902446.1 tRNA (guanosine(46)-N7)-methyltransferase TrmB [Staphylococcus gallinarum]MCD8908627.1 tRNA (guanosine(46)-N7)-methyltransferase TrmB [Staphylococcus gallinarum]MCD8919162.1 tRNA (guanosine(46)-N7)-methyltransferase TrmB [Staphylococcus gallinarum]MEB6236348.1 tRNA (guanosine(46)-N7)-methyltransferase TrmB [Staphylococc
MRMRHKPWAEDYLKSHSDIVDIDGSRSGHIREWFNNDQPIYIEVGSGMGQFITTLAAQNPEINFVSMEREKNVMVKVLDKVLEQNLSNIKLICNDAVELNEYFVDGEVDRLYLNFSDPWPKNRHAKRRLTYHTYLALYKQILKKDGELHFKTDNRGLFAYSLESMSQFGMYFTKINLNLHEEDVEGNIETEYERKFSEKGSRIYRMEAKFHS